MGIVSAPGRVRLYTHSSTSKTTFVVQIDIPAGQISRLNISSSLPLAEVPLSDEGYFTSLDPSVSRNFLFYPDDATLVAPTIIVTFSGLPDDGTRFEFEV